MQRKRFPRRAFVTRPSNLPSPTNVMNTLPHQDHEQDPISTMISTRNAITTRASYPPGLTGFQQDLHVLISWTSITTFNEDCQSAGDNKEQAAAETDPQVVNQRTGLAISKQSTPVPTAQAYATNKHSPTRKRWSRRVSHHHATPSPASAS